MTTNDAGRAADAFAAIGKDAFETARAACDKTISFGAGGLDAMAQASASVLTGMEACFAAMAEDARTATAENVETMERMRKAGSPEDFAGIQIEAANRAAARVVGRTATLARIAAETTTEAYAPFKARMDRAAQAFAEPGKV